jgi:hypothetical protein
MYSTILFYGYHILDNDILPDYSNIIYIRKRQYIESNNIPKWFHINCYDGDIELFYGFYLSKTNKITTYTNEQFETYDNMLKDYKFKFNEFDKIKSQLQDFYTEYQNEKNDLSMTFKRLSNYDDAIDAINIIDLYSDIDTGSEPDLNHKKNTYGIHAFNEICMC